ncbi:MAG: beta-ketoacyl-ACP synthase II [Alphaproteobacteria bacterium]|nr:beta-ketoacyl-ACP synthase II [Alphaproteobacteria bacterium]
MKRRVVVTGIGAVSPLGCCASSTWANLVACKSGIRPIDTFDVSDMRSKVAGMLPAGTDGFNPDLYMEPAEQHKVDRFIVYAVAAASQAFDDAGFSSLSEEQKGHTSVSVGSGIGGVSRLYDTSVTLHDEGARRVNPFFIPSVLVNLASGHVAIKFGLRGVNYSVVSACSSGTHSIGEAFRSIRDGYADFSLAGGAEFAVCPLGVAGFCAARALSTKYNDEPEKASRPWDKGRDGFVIGEGAGVIALETLESAKNRGAKIYGEIVGYGASCDAFHITAPAKDALGASASMENAIEDAGIPKDAIDYINAHGTSTPAGDAAEVLAVKRVFGAHAYKLNMSSTKSAMGHLLGAAGAVEAVICLQALNHDVVPATLNLDEPDDEFDLNLTPNTPQERKLTYVMSNSFGFGGTNGTLIFKKFQ